MSDVRALAAAVAALLPSTLNVFTDAVKPSERGQVPREALPWIVLQVQLPEVLSRSLAGTRQAGQVSIRTTIAGESRDAVRGQYAKVAAALESRRPGPVVGWRLAPIVQDAATDIVEDLDVTVTESNRHPYYAHIEWHFTATRSS